MNLTIRNIPENIIKKIRVLSESEKRSINSEILLIIEKGLSAEMRSSGKKSPGKETQVRLWKGISGRWKDERRTEDIISDIYSSRTRGRDFSLIL